MAQGHPIDIVIFLLYFLYYCLRLDKYPKIACLEAVQDDTLRPPEIIATIEAVTAIWLSNSKGYSPLIIMAGVKQLTFIKRVCCSQVISHAFLAKRIPALQMNKSIFLLRESRKLINYFTDALFPRSPSLHQQLPPAQAISLEVWLKRSFLLSMIMI